MAMADETAIERFAQHLLQKYDSVMDAAALRMAREDFDAGEYEVAAISVVEMAPVTEAEINEFLELAQDTDAEIARIVATKARQRPVIDRFRGEYFFLSNCYPAATPHRGRLFPTSEHAYMAARTDDADAIAAILATADPLEAQRIGRAAPLVDDWDQLRYAAMEEIVTAKFAHNADLAGKLTATAGAVLVEGNTWHDQTWGTCTCDEHRDAPGGNALGVILMSVRMRLAARGPRGAQR